MCPRRRNRDRVTLASSACIFILIIARKHAQPIRLEFAIADVEITIDVIDQHRNIAVLADRVLRFDVRVRHHRHIAPGQFIRLPAVSALQSGLPIGLQFVGRFGEEHLLLQLAAQIERTEPWSKKRPPVYG